MLTTDTLDGPTLYQELERRWPNPPPHVIFITDSRYAPDYSSFPMEVGAPMLAKPVTPTELWERVEGLLALR